MMERQNQFVIRNGSTQSLTLNIEPEAVLVSLDAGEDVLVTDEHNAEPLTIQVDSLNGTAIVSIWPGDGNVRVERNGVDVRESMPSSVNA